MVLDEIAVWGVLPIAALLLAWCAQRLAWVVLPKAEWPERAAATAVLAMALVHASVGLLGEVGALSRATLLGVLALLAVGLAAATRGARRDSLLRRAWQASPLAVGLIGVTMLSVVRTARLLPVWQWD